MSLTITATPARDAGTVTLSMTFTAELLTLTRADPNGTRPVRYAGDLWTAGQTARIIIDHEPALTGWVQYRAVMAGGVEASAWVNLAAGPAPLLPRFSLPAVPPNSVQVDLVTKYSGDRETRSTVHQIIDSDDPAITVGGLTPRTGSLEIIFDTYVQARDLESLLERGETVLLRQVDHQGLDMYFHTMGLSMDPDEDTGCWLLTVRYLEVGFAWTPLEDLSGWTFDALAAGNTSFDSVAVQFDTFNDVKTNDQNGTPE